MNSFAIVGIIWMTVVVLIEIIICAFTVTQLFVKTFLYCNDSSASNPNKPVYNGKYIFIENKQIVDEDIGYRINRKQIWIIVRN